MPVDVKQLIVLALLATVSVMLYVAPLIINQAWWSLLALLPLLFLPVPWFFVPPRDAFGSIGDSDTDTGRHWAEFITSCGAVGMLGIPIVLWHVEMITWIDVVVSCCGSLALACGWALFVFWQQRDGEQHGRSFL
ncbi:hypothetical protein KFE25_009481 [Diacronema lutheri]|uniref:Vacuolar protein sorting 55 n=1 Tax=Diacronema lutheri TaxID=2081491 RepID=A0A8J5XZW1_DIALT|nr:hypothetical protein KFE25_009481 [Diacronema lutheri]